MTSLLTKKDLEVRFGLADTTVYRTLQACGLSTSKKTYTPEEIEIRFVPARKLFDAGHTTEQVKEYFRLKQVTYDYQETNCRAIQHHH
ncbi:hypothetical protein IQ278_12095 [Tolypothrix sp. LEGE 11397]|uniref:hypothetical protein n=1 Tax=Tolypothrix sp. LEGE 11397 TaxID=2777971 RepID=UPI001880ACF3|nr:hypothetical protein [Tolypothrix sp. LEGE 11397]MBE9082855.1 hypothetical protein [Tolypothrix sp. LEGE 11397]